MARNVEIKARIEKLEELEGKIIELADKAPAELVQDDTFFRCDRGRLKLRAYPNGEGELIFYQRADESGPKESFYLITKTRQPEQLRDVLSMAYGAFGRVRKRRTLYFTGRTRIHVDRVEQLGNFLELEVVLSENESVENGVDEAREILQTLGVRDDQLIRGAYVDLLHESES